MELTVQQIDSDYRFSDAVRIPQKYRGGMKESKLCKLSTNVTRKIVQVYGKRDEHDANIYMDKLTQNHFGLRVGSVANFELVPVGWIGQLTWASRHADPTVRVCPESCV
jgi:hypothetical protein